MLTWIVAILKPNDRIFCLSLFLTLKYAVVAQVTGCKKLNGTQHRNFPKFKILLISPFLYYIYILDEKLKEKSEKVYENTFYYLEPAVDQQ